MKTREFSPCSVEGITMKLKGASLHFVWKAFCADSLYITAWHSYIVG